VGGRGWEGEEGGRERIKEREGEGGKERREGKREREGGKCASCCTNLHNKFNNI